MNSICEDAPCCGCCPVTADTRPPDEDTNLGPEGADDDDTDEDDAELNRDRILDEQEREDFAHDNDPDDLGPWDWMTD